MTFRRSRCIAGPALALAIGLGLAMSMQAHAQAMGPATMGGGMMGGGMMGGYGPRNEASSEGGASNPDWGKLTSYVQSDGLACMSCHNLSAKGPGPAYMDIAHRFTGRTHGASELTSAISNGVSGQWPGYPPMPGGLATPKQAETLAALILHLAR